jgi:hypothetical protein
MCYGCQNSGGVFSQSQRLRERGTTYYFELDRCCLCPEDLASYQQWFLELERGETYACCDQQEQRDR